MNKIEELINKYCPNGVEFVTLKDIGYFYSGLKSKNKNDFIDGNKKYIAYKDIFKNLKLHYSNLNQIVQIQDNENQNYVNKFDILFTGSSETLEECAYCSVYLSEEPVLLNSFCFGFRLNNKNVNPLYLIYLFFTDKYRKELMKCSKGVTRINVSKKDVENILIPLPPIEIQNEIVHILDTFTELITELITELKHRKIQYQYYLDNIFLCLSNPDSEECNTKFSELMKQLCPNGVEFVKLKDICTINKGKQLNKDKLLDINEGKYPVMNGGINPSGYWNEYNAVSNTITISQGGASAGYINWMNSNFFAGAHCYYLTQCFSRINYKFLYYTLKNNQENLMNNKQGDAIPGLNKEQIENILIPLPPIEIQNQIVNILDQFNDLTNSISKGLPKEIELRKQQYEYYRNKLLTFRQLEK